MKKLLINIILLFSVLSVSAADGDLFPYPKPPADMIRLEERCDFIISRFWRGCNIKSAMSKTDKLRSTFNDWVSFMPYATADTVHAAIESLLASVRKSGPETLVLAKMAEEFVYSDSSELRSAEVFLSFAKAAATNKKIGEADRRYFAEAVQRIENSSEGAKVGHFEITSPEGLRLSLDNYHTQLVIVLFMKHDDNEASLTRTRLAADGNIRKLIDRKLLTLICVEPAEPTQQWLAATSSYPPEWVVGAMPDAAQWFELSADRPSAYLLDGRKKVLWVNANIDQIKNGMAAAAANI